MFEIQDSVSKTALTMAAKRAIENQRSDRLFADPFAEKLAAAEIEALLEKWKKQDGDYDRIKSLRTRFVAVRTRFFDDFLMSVASKASQIVILGAGMDTRAFRLPWLKETHIYEIDRSEVIQRKDAILQDTPSKCHRQAIVADFRETWSNLLVDRGYRVDFPSIWLMEGLLTYLEEEKVNNLLETIADLSVTGSYLGADLVSTKSVQLGLESQDIRKHWHFGTDRPEQLFAKYGWNALVKQPGDEGASFDRYTQPLPLREVPGLRRSFFVTAEKIS